MRVHRARRNFRRRTGAHGQAIVELTFLLPLILLLSLSAYEAAVAMRYADIVTETSRIGASAAARDPLADVGNTVRLGMQGTVSTSAWGVENAAGTAAQCTGTGATATTCGDTSGCTASYFTTNTTAVACFAIGTCTGSCSSGGVTWNTRPMPGTISTYIDIRVVAKYTPQSPFAQFAGTGGNFYITHDDIVPPQY